MRSQGGTLTIQNQTQQMEGGLRIKESVGQVEVPHKDEKRLESVEPSCVLVAKTKTDPQKHQRKAGRRV